MLKVMLPWDHKHRIRNRWLLSSIDDEWGTVGCGYPSGASNGLDCWYRLNVKTHRFPAFKCCQISAYLLDSIFKEKGYYLL